MNLNKLKIPLIVVLGVLVLIGCLVVAMYLLSKDDAQNNYKEGAVEIIDGDTFRTAEGEIIRLLCVDTPEKNQEGYDEAVDFLGGRLFYSDIRLEGNKTDKYGRSLRWVYVDDILINKEIIDLNLGTLFEYEGEDCGLVKGE